MSISGVKHVIAVASGKGGVGKSTTAVNLALALAAEGHSVGLLDADIYGPSIPVMLGLDRLNEKGEGVVEQEGDNAFKPVRVHGIQTMSIGLLVTDQTPMAWRGPMASRAFQQIIMQTAWQEVDYLVVDMPPGTGDIQLTLAQKINVSGAVIVTTPQDIALLDAIKGIELFRKVNVNVLGVIENMAMHICSECGHAESIFGEGGGTKLAKEYDVDVLGQLPLQRKIREQIDAGTPTVVAEPDSEVAQQYRNIAKAVIQKIEDSEVQVINIG